MRIIFGIVATAFIFGSVTTASPAQEESNDQPSEPPPPPAFCKNNPGFDQFDFWLGEWDVHFNNEQQTLIGHNTIAKLSQGCLIMESFVSARGGEGFSLRHFNPATETWQNVWISNGYTVKNEGTQIEPGVIVLEGEIHYFASGHITGFRARFTANDDGTVRQFTEQYNQQTGTWDVWFDGIFKKSTASED